MELTRRSKQVLNLAEDIARRFGHNYVGTEHLLLALIEEQGGIAGQAIHTTPVSIRLFLVGLMRFFGQLAMAMRAAGWLTTTGMR